MLLPIIVRRFPRLSSSGPAALGIADFVVGSYRYNGATLTAADVVDNTTPIGAHGLKLRDGWSDIAILGDFAAALLTLDWTIVLELELGGDAAFGLRSEDDVLRLRRSSGTFVDRLFIGTRPNAAEFFALDNAGPDRGTADGDPVLWAGKHRLAVTRTDEKLALSKDGEPVIVNSDFLPFDLAPLEAHFVTTPDTIYVRRLEVYATRDDAILPGLSTGYSAPSAPANDAFANAITITAGSPLSAVTYAASKQSGEPDHAGNAGGTSAWWTFIAPASADYHVSLTGSDFDTLLGVYTGASVDALTEIASNDDSGEDPDNSFASALTFTAVSGTTYRIAVDGFDGATGNVAIAVTAA